MASIGEVVHCNNQNTRCLTSHHVTTKNTEDPLEPVFGFLFWANVETWRSNMADYIQEDHGECVHRLEQLGTATVL